MSKGCVVLLIGLPAAGKSTLLERLKAKYAFDAETNAFVVQFDAIVSLEEQKELFAVDNKGFKQTRRDLVSACELLLQRLTKIGEYQFPNEDVKRMFTAIMETNENFEKSNFVLLVDDNLYLRSMRFNFAKLAKRYNLGFSQVLVDTPLGICVSRNETRINKVPEEVIIRMNSVFEKPNADKHHWEVNSVSFTDGCTLDDIFALITQAMNNPFVEQLVDNEERNRNKAINNSNFMHQFDCLLRRIIREEITNTEIANRRSLAEQLQKAKKEMLRKTRELDVSLPNWFIEQLTDDERYEDVVCADFVRKVLYS